MTRRTEKAAQAIREIVSTTILLGLRDPRIKNVTVLRADVSTDLRNVDIYVSVMGEDNVKALTMQGLKSARGFLQSKIADRIKTKNTPVITFKMEDVATSIAMETARILHDLEAERDEHGPLESTDEDPDDSDNMADAQDVDEVAATDGEESSESTEDYHDSDDTDSSSDSASSTSATSSELDPSTGDEAADDAGPSPGGDETNLGEDKESTVHLGQNP